MDKKFLKKIIAQSPEDLQMISACCSEGKVKISDIKYLPSNKIFLISILLISLVFGYICFLLMFAAVSHVTWLFPRHSATTRNTSTHQRGWCAGMLRNCSQMTNLRAKLRRIRLVPLK